MKMILRCKQSNWIFRSPVSCSFKWWSCMSINTGMYGSFCFYGPPTSSYTVAGCFASPSQCWGFRFGL